MAGKDDIEGFLNRETDNEPLIKLVHQWGDLIDETVSFGGKVFDWCHQAAAGHPQDTPLPLLLSLRHILEMLDAIAVLTRNRCAEPIKPLLRSILEAVLYIEYILEDDKEWERRALSYVFVSHKDIDLRLEIADPSTERGKKFAADKQRDKLAADMTLPPLPPSAGKSKKLALKPQYRAIAEEWERQRKTRRGRIQWYSLFGGPRSLEELARRVGLPVMYEILYRHYSDYSHVGHLMGNLIGTPSGKVAFISLRHPKELQTLVGLSILMAAHSYRVLLEFYDRGKLQEFGRWYLRIENPLQRLFGPPLIEIKDD